MISRLARSLGLALSVTALAACSGGSGGGQQSGGTQLAALTLSRLLATLPGIGGGGAGSPDARDVLTGDLIAGSDTSLLLVVVDNTDIGYTMIPRAENLGTEQWRDAGAGALLRRDGILVGTRAFGFDLLTAQTDGLARALRTGGGRDVQRVNRVIDGESQVIARQYLCDVVPTGRETLTFFGTSYATTRFEERCTSELGGFSNIYWVDSSGFVRKSRERVSDKIGTITIDVLKS